MSSRMASAARWGALCLAVTLGACTEKEPGPGNGTPSPNTPSDAPAPNSVTGIALDAQGRPIANAKVSLNAAVEKADPIVVRTGADGRYKVEGLPSAPYRVYAWTEVQFNGQPFCLRLGMPDASQYEVFNPSQGAVRDFRWQLTGRIENFTGDPVYFGGKVLLDLTGDFSGGTLQLTFTPTSPHIDGSPASTVTRTLQFDGTQEAVVQDVPVANYTVTGTLTKGGTQRPVHIGSDGSLPYDEQTESAQLKFRPGGNPCISLASGVNHVYLFLSAPN